MTFEKVNQNFVDTFGEHRVASGGIIAVSILDLIDPELHPDGSYTLHLDSQFYVRSLRDQYWSFPDEVLEFEDGGGFLSIDNREEAEEAALKIAGSVNEDVQKNYVENPDIPVEEVIAEKYEQKYGSAAPGFQLQFHGSVDVVGPDDLVEYWEEIAKANSRWL